MIWRRSATKDHDSHKERLERTGNADGFDRWPFGEELGFLTGEGCCWDECELKRGWGRKREIGGRFAGTDGVCCCSLTMRRS